MKSGLFILLVASVLELASSQTGENAKALRQKLFVTDQYDKKVRSAKDQTNPTGKTLILHLCNWLLMMLDNFQYFYRLFIFFRKQTFHSILDIPSQCQTIWNEIRPYILFSVIWIQTICNSYLQTILKEKELSCCDFQINWKEVKDIVLKNYSNFLAKYTMWVLERHLPNGYLNVTQHTL